jgi:peptidoglycan/LPS O-acetylase OafA/YrhL
MMVVIYHFFPFIAHFQGHSAAWLAAGVLRAGFTGVDLFFVLSGFLIAGILIDNRHSSSYFKAFYARRACRIFPLYYVLVGSLFALAALIPTNNVLLHSPLPAWSYALFLQNFVMAASGTYGAIWLAGSWSLAIEEQFYIFLSLAVRVSSSRRVIAAIGFGLVVIAPLARFIMHRTYPTGYIDINYLLSITRCDPLGVGILLALAYRHPPTWRVLERYSPVVLALSAVAVAYLFKSWQIHTEISYLVYAVFYGALIVFTLAARIKCWTAFVSTPVMRELGNMSYSTYMLHGIILRVTFWLALRTDPRADSLSDVPVLLAALAITLAASWASWHWFERKFVRIGAKFSY